MTVGERRRHRLYEEVAEAMSEESAETLMEYLPPVGWADVATKRDLGELEARTALRLDEMERRFEIRLDGTDQRFEARLQAELRKQTYHFVGWLLTGLALFAVAQRWLEHVWR